jgi:SDR family mycofactocin-dependent oxidoreductase
MAGRLEGKVALISGAARGQGRSHAVRLAQEGADIIAFDVCHQLGTVPYPMADSEDLKETVRLVEDLDRRIVAREADVRDAAAVQAVVDEGVSQFGRLDVISANAGIASFVENTWSMTEEQWEEMIAVNLSGVWRTVRAGIPKMIEGGNGGSIVLTSSTAGVKGMAGIGHYVAAKHGVVGLTKSAAIEYAQDRIRVNCINPGYITTPMTTETVAERGDEIIAKVPMRRMGVPNEIAEAVAWMCSDKASFMTGATHLVDGGYCAA